MRLRYICNRDDCRYTACPRHPEGQDENISRINLCGSSQCAMWVTEDDGDVTLNPKMTRNNKERGASKQ